MNFRNASSLPWMATVWYKIKGGDKEVNKKNVFKCFNVSNNCDLNGRLSHCGEEFNISSYNVLSIIGFL